MKWIQPQCLLLPKVAAKTLVPVDVDTDNLASMEDSVLQLLQFLQFL